MSTGRRYVTESYIAKVVYEKEAFEQASPR